MTTQQKISNQIISWKETDSNRLTDEEALEYAQELEAELYNVSQLSYSERVIYEALEEASPIISH